MDVRPSSLSLKMLRLGFAVGIHQSAAILAAAKAVQGLSPAQRGLIHKIVGGNVAQAMGVFGRLGTGDTPAIQTLLDPNSLGEPLSDLLRERDLPVDPAVSDPSEVVSADFVDLYRLLGALLLGMPAQHEDEWAGYHAQLAPVHAASADFLTRAWGETCRTGLAVYAGGATLDHAFGESAAALVRSSRVPVIGSARPDPFSSPSTALSLALGSDAFEDLAAASSPHERVDWGAETVISPDYIAKIAGIVDSIFVDKERDIKSPSVPNIPSPHYESAQEAEMRKRLNPLSLRLPYFLTHHCHLYDSHRLPEERFDFHHIHDKTAQAYLDLLILFQKTYVSFLKAINGSKDDRTRLQALLDSQEAIFEQLKAINPNVKAKKETFIHSWVGYLALEILFSRDAEITTAARVRALELVASLGTETIARAFAKETLGYQLPYNAKDEPAYDLIPRAFVSSPAEAGGTPHNELFLQNERLCALFGVTNDNWAWDERRQKRSLDPGLARLVSDHPGEVLQVLRSFLKLGKFEISGESELVFTFLVGLSRLDPFQRTRIFGNIASYRDPGGERRTTGDRAGWALGRADFGGLAPEAELAALSRGDLVGRLRQMAYRLHLADARAVEAEGREAEAFFRIRGAEFHDPKGYFRTMMMRPDTPEEMFEETLKRHHRILALKYHPDPNRDDPKAEEKFKAMQEAFEFLSDPAKRKAYLASSLS